MGVSKLDSWHVNKVSNFLEKKLRTFSTFIWKFIKRFGQFQLKNGSRR